MYIPKIIYLSISLFLLPSLCSSLTTYKSIQGRLYLYYPNSDVNLDNETIFPEVPNLKNNISALASLCDITPTCIGFNTNGWLKNGSTSLGPNIVDVYLITDTPPLPYLNVWPYPTSVTINYADNIPLIISTPIQFIATNPSVDLTNAFQRFTSLMFPHGTNYNGNKGIEYVKNKYSTSVPVLSSITVTVTDVNIPLQLGVDESYTLSIPSSSSSSTTITITANTVYGAYHGLQTLSQLIAFDFSQKTYWVNSSITIDDSPKFAWRGLMIDPARRYLPVSYIYTTIDSMTYAKLNLLHIHIVDCDSWPIEVTGNYDDLWASAFSPRERYTVEDLQSIVEYGRQRGVRIMYEYDTPGHSGSSCKAYPQVCPSPTCPEPLNPASNDTLPLINSVIDTLASVSIDTVLHLGGDEVNPTCWNNSVAIQAWMQQHNMTSTDQIYEYFVSETNAMALQKKLSPMRWEEVWKHFRTELDPSTIVHAWLSNEAMNDAANNGYRTVFSVSGSDYYLDYLDITWDETYNVNILETVTNSSAIPYILGAETCMWGETVDAGTFLQTIWPRAAAAAERWWSNNFATSTSQSWDVINRFAQFRCLLLERGIPAASPGNPTAGSMGPAWTVGSCGGGYKDLC